MMVEFLEPNAHEVQRSIMSEFLEVSGDGPAIAGFFEQMLFEIDTRDLMSRVSVPTLVIHGQEDQTIPLAAGRELASSIRGAQFEILAGANHGEGTIMSPRIPALIDEFLSAAAPRRM
jgi:pimeloyl-ACP methyl ester carboxylesterase